MDGSGGVEGVAVVGVAVAQLKTVAYLVLASAR